MKVEVLVKETYGTKRFYPISDDAKVLAKLIGRPTLTAYDISECQNAGWEVVGKRPDFDFKAREK